MIRAEGYVVALCTLAGAVALVTATQTVPKTGDTPRTKAWADMVEDCEKHGGVAVPRATRVLGRSAELPACVPQLGD